MGIAQYCLGSVLALSAVVAPAAAQTMKDVPPYSAVVTADNASIRCGPGMYYRVAELPKFRIGLRQAGQIPGRIGRRTG